MPISVLLQGRLGNQLFQYACCRSISLEKNIDMVIKTDFTHHGQKCLIDHFNIYNNKKLLNKKYDFVYHEGSLSKYTTLMFDKNVRNIKDKTILVGYFQNYKYFKNITEIIKNDFKLNQSVLNIASTYINNLKKTQKKQKLISINIRRGDYNGIYFNEDYVIKYINKCLSKIENIDDKIIIIFIGGAISKSDDDINWVKENILLKNYIISPYSINSNIILDLAISKMCDYMIIPIMSTINWWILFLNNNNPKNNFVPLKDPDNNIISYDLDYNIIEKIE